jgi:hypothetical protein
MIFASFPSIFLFPQTWSDASLYARDPLASKLFESTVTLGATFVPDAWFRRTTAVLNERLQTAQAMQRTVPQYVTGIVGRLVMGKKRLEMLRAGAETAAVEAM